MAIFYARGKNSYAVALERPDDPAIRSAIDKIAKLNRVKFQLFATSREDIDYAIALYQKKVSEHKKEKLAVPILKRPQESRPEPEPRPTIKPKTADDDVITLGSLFSSFLGGDENETGKKSKQPVVTINDFNAGPTESGQTTTDSKLLGNEPAKEVRVEEKVKDQAPVQPETQPETKEQEERQEQAEPKPLEAKKEEVQTGKTEIKAEELENIEEGEESSEETMDSVKIGRLLTKEVKTGQDLAIILKENYIPKTVAALINYALNMRASDIHIEPGAKNLRVRFRVDGILQDIVMLPLKLHPPIISRIKILSKMKIDETRVPQDGRFDLPFREREVDVRVSCLPTVHGEKIVMRILDKSQGILSLEDLGMVGRAFDLTIESIKKPYGIILSTGPTGSGKSTTLYAAISRLSSPSINIVTLEDPVEYEIPGVNQCQVKPSIGFTFADGLRSVLRQDPNVVMVGEIRDGETASMATHAALTGHLVLSTLHTNDAASALPRLINMGIEPFLITSSINLIIAQRLVRRICPDCKKESKIPEGLVEEIKKELAAIPKSNIKDIKRAEGPLKFYHGTGCVNCSQGYKGRVGIFEVIRMTGEIEELAVSRRPANEIKAAAIKDGLITIKQDGILKSMEGLTTLDEVFQASTS